MSLHCYSLLHNISYIFVTQLSEQCLFWFVVCSMVVLAQTFNNPSIKSLCNIWLPVDFTKKTRALIAAMPRMLTHTASGHLLEVDRVLYKQAI